MERFIIPSAYLGAISGLVLGILLLIPFISPLIFFMLFLIAGVAVIVLLKRSSSVGILSIYDGCFIGAVAGFTSLMAASVVFLPVKVLFGGFTSIKGYDVLAVLMLVFSTSLLSALFNAFTGLVTAYIYEKIETKNLTFHEHFDIEQSEEDI